MLFERSKRDVSLIRRIKNWAYELLPIAEDAVVSVMELECTEEGCPPVETIIAAIEKGKPTRQWKIHKPISEITRQNLSEIHQDNYSEDASKLQFVTVKCSLLTITGIPKGRICLPSNNYFPNRM